MTGLGATSVIRVIHSGICSCTPGILPKLTVPWRLLMDGNAA
jgi:hypothetical protein